ncbi:LCP family protein [Candidatus Dojkabacteria bacterium]|nr:LCP family protein [Candidatus Dojkabacteria bacterium]
MKNIFTKLKRKLKSIPGKRGKRKGLSRFSIFSSSRNILNRKGRFQSGIKNMLSILLILLVIGSIIAWLSVTIYKVVSVDFEPDYRDKYVEKSQEWRGEGRLNILLVGLDRRESEYAFCDALIVIMIDPFDRSIGIFDINPDTLIYLQKYNKNIKLRNLYNFGILESEEIPVELLLEGVEDLISIKISRYVVVDEEGIMRIADTLGGVYVSNTSDLSDKDISDNGKNFSLGKGNFRLGGQDLLNFLRADDDGVESKFLRQIAGTEGLFKRSVSYSAILRLPNFWSLLSQEIRTNLSKKEIMRLGIMFGQYKDLKTAFMSIEAAEIREGESGLTVLPIFDELDQDIQRVFIDNRVGKEQARVEIFNSTNIRGLGNFRTRWLKNIGIDVIRVGDASPTLAKTTIYTREGGEYPNTIEAIDKSFDEEIEVLEGELPNFVCTGDVIVVLGANVED